MTTHTAEDLATLTELVAELDERPLTPDVELAREHFNCARLYLQGEMPVEYETALQLDRESVSQLGHRSEKLDELLWRLGANPD